MNPNREPVLSYALTSPDLSQAVLREIAVTQIVPKLYGTPGIGQLLVTGGPAAEFHVELDPAQLAARGIGAADVSRALADANNVEAIGVTQQYYQKYAVLIDASLRDAASLRAVQIPVKNGDSVPLASLGTVTLGVSPVTDQISVDGRHAVIVNAYGLPGADTVKMADAFRARWRALTAQLPQRRDGYAVLGSDHADRCFASGVARCHPRGRAARHPRDLRVLAQLTPDADRGRRSFRWRWRSRCSHYSRPAKRSTS